MAEIATAEDRKFAFLKDIDGNEAPVFIGSIVSAINSGVVPGFAALNQTEAETLNLILIDAEHHHRNEMLFSGNAEANYHNGNTARLMEIERRIRNLRKRFGLPAHYDTVDCCPYMKHENHSASVGGRGIGI